MRVKVCGVKTKADLDAVIKSGADAAGFLVGQIHPSPDFILPSTASRLSALLPPYVTPVIVTHLTEAEAINEIIYKTGITTVQLHGDSPFEEVKKLRDLMPVNSKLILAAHIINNKLAPELEEFSPFVNALLLDSYNEETGMVGGTGQTHNWRLSAEIVKTCSLPVILAGGLNPDNVVEAIRVVQPYGVDANSGLRGAEDNRSLELCTGFVRNAKSA